MAGGPKPSLMPWRRREGEKREREREKENRGSGSLNAPRRGSQHTQRNTFRHPTPLGIVGELCLCFHIIRTCAAALECLMLKLRSPENPGEQIHAYPSAESAVAHDRLNCKQARLVRGGNLSWPVACVCKWARFVNTGDIISSDPANCS